MGGRNSVARIQNPESRSQESGVRSQESGVRSQEGDAKEGLVAAKSFEDLIVWQRAHEFVLGVYGLTARFPRDELFGLTSQLRRAAVSVAANIAEGFKRRGKGDKLRFYNTSQASLEECRYHL